MRTRTDEVEKVLVRVPTNVKQWLEAQCVKNLTSYSSEITFTLRARMDRQDEKKLERVMGNLAEMGITEDMVVVNDE